MKERFNARRSRKCGGGKERRVLIFDAKPVAEVIAEIDTERGGQRGYVRIYTTIHGREQSAPQCGFPFLKGRVPYRDINALLESYADILRKKLAEEQGNPAAAEGALKTLENL